MRPTSLWWAAMRGLWLSALLVVWGCCAPHAAAEEDEMAGTYRELAKAFDSLQFEGDGKLDRSGFAQLVLDMGVAVPRTT